MDIATFTRMALALPQAEELPHFEKTSFRVGKKIFATLDIAAQRACVKLSAVDQSVFCAYDPKAIFPVPNKWGQQGWTFIDLTAVHPDMCADALTTAYCEVAPKKLAESVRKEG
jgi:hypothetical protein